MRTRRRETGIGVWGGLTFSSQPTQTGQRGGAWPSLAAATAARGFRRRASVRACVSSVRHGVWADPAFGVAPGHRRASSAEVSTAAHASAASCPPQASAALSRGIQAAAQETLPGRGLVCRRPSEQRTRGTRVGGSGTRRTSVIPRMLAESLFAAVSRTDGVQTPWRSPPVTARTTCTAKLGDAPNDGARPGGCR